MWKVQQSTLDPQQILYEIGVWVPELGLGEVFINPTHQEKVEEKLKEIMQNMVSGYLFNRNRALFESKGKTLDEEKAKGK